MFCLYKHHSLDFTKTPWYCITCTCLHTYNICTVLMLEMSTKITDSIPRCMPFYLISSSLVQFLSVKPLILLYNCLFWSLPFSLIKNSRPINQWNPVYHNTISFYSYDLVDILPLGLHFLGHSEHLLLSFLQCWLQIYQLLLGVATLFLHCLPQLLYLTTIALYRLLKPPP